MQRVFFRKNVLEVSIEINRNVVFFLRILCVEGSITQKTSE